MLVLTGTAAFLVRKEEKVYLRDTLRLPARGSAPLHTPCFSILDEFVRVPRQTFISRLSRCYFWDMPSLIPSTSPMTSSSVLKAEIEMRIPILSTLIGAVSHWNFTRVLCFS